MIQNSSRRFYAAAQLIEKISQKLNRARGPGEMQPLQWSILRCISRHEDAAPHLLWIADYLGLTHAPVSRAVSTLIKRGFLTQSASAHDKRKRHIELTVAGKIQLEEDPLQQLVIKLRNIDEPDFNGLIRTLEKLVLKNDEK